MLQNTFHCEAHNLLFSIFYLETQPLVTIHRTIIMFLVCYGCKTWYLALITERRLNVSENTMQMEIFQLQIKYTMGLKNFT
jgi:hypothetical protein